MFLAFEEANGKSRSQQNRRLQPPVKTGLENQSQSQTETRKKDKKPTCVETRGKWQEKCVQTA